MSTVIINAALSFHPRPGARCLPSRMHRPGWGQPSAKAGCKNTAKVPVGRRSSEVAGQPMAVSPTSPPASCPLNHSPGLFAVPSPSRHHPLQVLKSCTCPVFWDFDSPPGTCFSKWAMWFTLSFSAALPCSITLPETFLDHLTWNSNTFPSNSPHRPLTVYTHLCFMFLHQLAAI